MRISDWSSDVCSSDLRKPISGRGIGRDEVAQRLDLPFLADDRQGSPHKVVSFFAPRGACQTFAPSLANLRSEERRVRKECVSTCRSRWSPYPLKKKMTYYELDTLM